ncbi:hypothetical protein PhCBS80983_g01319 [Powellomyces hirtus]|uniref:Calponin-homology (CH) domain-containing protein n=1 Tax=Powellomyces hirtus TaxID=109895 RepID=A0A507EBH7_9FUNG|nr:hypothetical protein PhCBS80983_g01319 [Powellomyces hirtus]
MAPPQYQDVSLSPTTDSKEDMDREIEAFAEHIRNLFADVAELSPKYIPVTKETFFSKFQDGVLLAHIINSIKANSVLISKLNTHIDATHLNGVANGETNHPEQTKAILEATNNLNICIEAAKKVAVVVNVAAEDFLRKKPDLVLGVMWQLIRSYLLSEVNLPSHPELIRLLEPGESLTHLIGLSNEQVLLRWVNFHLARSGSAKRISNFSKDISDSEAYILLLQQVCPWNKQRELEECLSPLYGVALNEKEARAAGVLQAAEKLGCRKFATAGDIASGHARLNVLFVATIFAKHIGIHLPTEDEARAAVQRLGEAEADNSMYRSRIIELEKTVAALNFDLEEHRAAHAKTISTFEEKLKTDTEGFKHSMDELRFEKEQESESWEEKMVDLQARFAALRDDQDKAVASQADVRTFIVSKLRAVKEMLAQHVKEAQADGGLEAKFAKLLGSSNNCAEDENVDALIDAAVADASAAVEFKPPAAGMEEELRNLSADLQGFVKDILDENRQQKKLITVLASKAEQHEKINNLLGDKIKVYSEAQIAANPIKTRDPKKK